MKLSVVIPVYKAATCLDELYKRLTAVLVNLNHQYEIILVEDHGSDGSWEIIHNLALMDSHIIGIKLSRNFGQHYAITAGLDKGSGDWFIIMDCDLQDIPEEIPNLLSEALKGHDIVMARRIVRRDSFFKRLSSKLFYKILSYLTDTKQDASIANFGIYSNRAIDAVRKMRENLRYFPVMIRWVGFKSTTIEVRHAEREFGKTSYSLRKLINLATEVMISFSDKPLRLTIGVGAGISCLSFIYALYIFIHALVVRRAVMGWSSLIFSVWFLSGLIICTLGIIGIYIGKTFDQVKKRPLYIVEDEINA
jgi:glycosyltransferase involved in cell wall biosynthesis